MTNFIVYNRLTDEAVYISPFLTLATAWVLSQLDYELYEIRAEKPEGAL